LQLEAEIVAVVSRGGILLEFLDDWTEVGQRADGRQARGVSRTDQAAQVYGIDYAAGSVAASRAHNSSLIAEGRAHVEQGSVSRLPFANDTFDVVTAIETQYYWPDLDGDMKEILRVLKPGGQLLVVAENYKGARNDAVLGPVMKLLGSSRLSVDDHRALFLKAGYQDVEI
jgi:ubiquinone/menaquinone biosynthesis C-methylase UbiE